MGEFSQEGDNLLKNMEGRHQSEVDGLRADLEKQLSFKVKESSEALNLRKQ